LLASALAGLLCLAACSEENGPELRGAAGAGGQADQPELGNGGKAEGGADSAGGSAGMPPVGGGGAAPDGAAGSPGGSGGDGSPDTAGASGLSGGGGAAPEPAHVTSSQNVGVMTEQEFTELCNTRGGTVEVMPHCGGFATAPGFSYDATTQLLSEHTCAGANTCTGWNCAITE